MIKQLLQRVFKPGKKQAGKQPADPAHRNAQTIPRRIHGIERQALSSAALRTTEGLQQAGFEAYVVGGAVRDLLLKRTPKDFDVATNATPEQVRRVFRRSRIIGRRFRLVHVLFGDETVEVSTFRGSHAGDDERARTAESGRILRDNVFGSQTEDAARRDFTANALYYDPASETILDFHHGVADIKAGVLRIIGDPATRYREDPVRMLRAIRLAAKLGLKLDEAAEAPIPALAGLLKDVPESRLFDEMLKLLLSGHALESVKALRRHGLHHGLLPLLDVVLEQPQGKRFIELALHNTDERVRAGKPVSPAFLFATLLWYEVLTVWQKFEAEGLRPVPALQLAMSEVIETQSDKLSIHKRYSSTTREIWGMQPRFEHRSGKRPFGLVAHPRFRAAYDFLLLRCAAGEVSQEIGQWWDDFAQADSAARDAMLLPGSAPKKRRRRRKAPKAAAEAPGQAA